MRYWTSFTYTCNSVDVQGYVAAAPLCMHNFVSQIVLGKNKNYMYNEILLIVVSSRTIKQEDAYDDNI